MGGTTANLVCLLVVLSPLLLYGGHSTVPCNDIIVRSLSVLFLDLVLFFRIWSALVTLLLLVRRSYVNVGSFIVCFTMI